MPEDDRCGRSLFDSAGDQDDPNRIVLSQYHAVGADTVEDRLITVNMADRCGTGLTRWDIRAGHDHRDAGGFFVLV